MTSSSGSAASATMRSISAFTDRADMIGAPNDTLSSLSPAIMAPAVTGEKRRMRARATRKLSSPIADGMADASTDSALSSDQLQPIAGSFVAERCQAQIASR